MEEFLKFFDEKRKSHCWNLEIYYSSIMDWNITIGYKTTHPKHGENIIHIQNCDMEFVFAKAYVELKEWLLENEGGY